MLTLPTTDLQTFFSVLYFTFWFQLLHVATPPAFSRSINHFHPAGFFHYLDQSSLQKSSLFNPISTHLVALPFHFRVLSKLSHSPSITGFNPTVISLVPSLKHVFSNRPPPTNLSSFSYFNRFAAYEYIYSFLRFLVVLFFRITGSFVTVHPNRKASCSFLAIRCHLPYLLLFHPNYLLSCSLYIIQTHLLK
jgi:hypothetical protein